MQTVSEIYTKGLKLTLTRWYGKGKTMNSRIKLLRPRKTNGGNTSTMQTESRYSRSIGTSRTFHQLPLSPLLTNMRRPRSRKLRSYKRPSSHSLPLLTSTIPPMQSTLKKHLANYRYPLNKYERPSAKYHPIRRQVQ